MDGLEASRQIQERLPPERRPVIVALSADTLQVSEGGRPRDAAVGVGNIGAVRWCSQPTSWPAWCACHSRRGQPLGRFLPLPAPCVPTQWPLRVQALHERCREAGMREFITKPFRVEDVKRVLQMVQQQAQQQQASSTPVAAV